MLIIFVHIIAPVISGCAVSIYLWLVNATELINPQFVAGV
ncbi:type I toxin-antitoxin system Fst family toxin [Staphylococcus aureus]